jgi:hypothetical protein
MFLPIAPLPRFLFHGSLVSPEELVPVYRRARYARVRATGFPVVQTIISAQEV